MYVSKPELANGVDVDQGDILDGLLLPVHAVDKAFLDLKDLGTTPSKPNWPKTIEHLGKDSVLAHNTRRVSGIVLTSSCDNFRGTNQLILAPILATSAGNFATAQPSERFLLHADATHGIADESWVDFANAAFLMPSALTRLLKCGAKRRVGLTPKALVQLQRSLQDFFGVE